MPSALGIEDETSTTARLPGAHHVDARDLPVDLEILPTPEPAPPARRGLAHVGALDGLRGLAVIGVVLFHSGVALPGGFLGVSTFFTLSGFLITSLLLAEHGSKRGISLRTFWVRRVRRLLPAALVALALCAAFTWLLGDAVQRSSFRGDALAALGYSANWRFVFSGQSYASQFAAPSPVLHFWSLAIEEQFYLLFPLLAFAVLRVARAGKRAFGVVLAAAFVASAALPHVASWSHDRVYFGTDTRAAELLAGALLAVVLARRDRPFDELGRDWSRRTRGALALLGISALGAMLVAWAVTTEESAWVYAGGLPLYALVTVVVILATVVAGNPVHRALALRPLRFLGRISYGVYLYHWPVLLWLTPARTGWAPGVRLVVASAITLAIATVSYVFVEQPIREGNARWRPVDRSDPFARLRRPPARVARLAPIAITVVVALILLSTIPQEQPGAITLDVASGTLVSDIDAHRPSGPLDLSAPTAGTAPSTTSTTVDDRQAAAALVSQHHPLTPKAVRPPSRPLRMLVVGDSTAVFLDPPLNEWGGVNKIWGAANYARIGCGFGRGGQRRNHFADEWIPPECSSWATEWPAIIRQTRPDIVVVADGFWDATDRQLLNDDQWRAPGDPVYDDYLRNEFGVVADTLSATGAVVAWLDNPPVHIGGSDAHPLRDLDINDPQRMIRTNEILHDVAATRPFMRVIPYRSFYEAWPGGPMDPTLRPDFVHVDAKGGNLVVQWLGPEVLDAYWSVKDPQQK